MKNIKLILLLLLLIVSTVSAKKVIKKDIDLNTLSLRAQEENKHILLYFKTSYCPLCTKMEKFTFNNKEIKSQLNKNFIMITINLDDDENIKYKDFFDSKRQFGKYLDISFYPTLIFMDENSELVYTLKGYKMNKKFKNILEYIKTKSYINEIKFNK